MASRGLYIFLLFEFLPVDISIQKLKRCISQHTIELMCAAMLVQVCTILDPRLRAAILEHHQQVFACATSSGMRQKEQDWLT